MKNKERRILIDDTYSFWVFVMKLSSCELFESTWIPLREKDTQRQTLVCMTNELSILAFYQDVSDNMRTRSFNMPETSLVFHLQLFKKVCKNESLHKQDLTKSNVFHLTKLV